MVRRTPPIRGALRQLALCLLVATPAVAQPYRAPETDVKAAFIYHFGKFVDWPPGTLAQLDRVHVCVAGDDALAHALETVLGVKVIQDRPATVHRVAPREPVATCQILYIGAAAADELPALLDAVAGHPILTIGDLPRFATAGTVIAFVREQQNVRFVINAAAADRAHLRISSRLLKLATAVLDTVEPQDH